MQNNFVYMQLILLFVCLGFFPSLSKMETCMKGCKFRSLLGLMGIVRILSRVPHLLHLPTSIHSYIWSSSRNCHTQICCQRFSSTTVTTCFDDLVCRGRNSNTQPSAREANACGITLVITKRIVKVVVS